jgi:hypothetical protein
MLRFIIAMAIATSMLQTSAIAKVNNRYAKWKFGQPYGYRDLKILPTRYKIRSMSFHAGMDFTVTMALHRLAVHAKANGFDRFYTVSMKVRCSNLFSGAPSGCKGTSLNEEVDIVAIGYSGDDLVPRCEETGDWASNCKSFEVDNVLSELRTPLGLTVEQVEQEIVSVQMTKPKPSK